jgi:hypothetical protein
MNQSSGTNIPGSRKCNRKSRGAAGDSGRAHAKSEPVKLGGWSSRPRNGAFGHGGGSAKAIRAGRVVNARLTIKTKLNRPANSMFRTFR